jgi:ARID/BRIGHT DNA binding domain
MTWQSIIVREGISLVYAETNTRTPFQPEPVVGHRKISLLKLYHKILELGGYDAVTEEKGFLQP